MKSEFTLYGDSRSGNCLKVLWTANYLGIACRWIETDIMAGASRTPEFLALNKFGQVPTAVFGQGKDQFAIAQSNALVLYLAERARHPSFLPIDAEPRARVYEWLFWEQNSHEPYIAGRRFRRSIKGLAADQIDPEWLPRGNSALARMNDALASAPYLVGNQLTAADIVLLAYTRVAPEGDFSLDPYANLHPWIVRVEHALEIAPVSKG